MELTLFRPMVRSPIFYIRYKPTKRDIANAWCTEYKQSMPSIGDVMFPTNGKHCPHLSAVHLSDINAGFLRERVDGSALQLYKTVAIQDKRIPSGRNVASSVYFWSCVLVESKRSSLLSSRRLCSPKQLLLPRTRVRSLRARRLLSPRRLSHVSSPFRSTRPCGRMC